MFVTYVNELLDKWITAEYETGEGELTVLKIWVNGTNITDNWTMWNNLILEVELECFKDYVATCEQQAEDDAVAWMELHED